MQLHKSQDNHIVAQCYAKHLDGKPGGHTAHRLLHTDYHSRRRIMGEPLTVLDSGTGRSCWCRCAWAQVALCAARNPCCSRWWTTSKPQCLDELVEVQATFCFERCDRGPTVHVGQRDPGALHAGNGVSVIETQLAAVTG